MANAPNWQASRRSAETSPTTDNVCPSMSRWVYDFADGSKDMRELLGGKGANVAEMTRVLGADRVPAGFTITTEACVEYMNAGREEPEGMAEQVAEALGRLEARAEKTLGDGDEPLLVSVRSGARESMPGMLDTVLNLGLNDESVQGLAKATENDRFAWDSYRRFVQMFGNVSRGISGDKFEDAIKAAKQDRGVSDDTELDVDALRELTNAFKGIYGEETGEDFPQDPQEQLRLSIRAVFDSWVGDRAVEYRRQNRIPDDWGTAVNVQQMVFGNKGDTSGSGVAFSRDEVTGALEPSGDFLPNAQGEDVVSGVRTPRDISDMQEWMPAVHEQLMEILRTLEAHYEDMQDTEFTVEEGQLYMLQTRNAKRPAQAAVRFAVDAVSEHLLSRERALATIEPGSLDALLHPTFDPDADFEVLASGVNASPGAAKGTIVFSAADAVAAAEEGRDVILVRPFTDAEDVAGFFAAKGILTSEGGKASHAALVARGMGRPAVVGAQALQINLEAKTVSVNGTQLHEGDAIAIDGTKGCVTTDDVPLVEAQVDENFEQVLEWADELRRMDVRTNADTPEDARRARELGADPVPATSWATAVFAGRTPTESRTAEQNEALTLAATLTDELGNADALLFAVPLYNFGVSQHFKAWVDMVMTDPRMGAGAEPILAGKPAILVTVRGGSYRAGTPREGWDHATGWMRRILEDVWRLDLNVVESEFTLAGVNPALDEFKDLARQLRSEAEEQARGHGRALGATISTTGLPSASGRVEPAGSK
jgi:pyruvate, orthophosphate dikinase